MTTVTPSGRAGAASSTSASAKRPAEIPTQRSGRALRLLVIGTGADTAAFREHAAAAGAELAQRFSVRVTHVVVEDGIGDQDARIVRARAAGLPVLDLAEGARLIAEETAWDGAGDSAGDGKGADAVEERDGELDVREDAGEGGVRGEAGADSRTGADSGAGTGTGAGADSGDGDGGDGAGRGRVAEESAIEGDATGAAGQVVTPQRAETEPDRAVLRWPVPAPLPETSSDEQPHTTTVDSHTRVVSVVHPRVEFPPEPTEIRPSDLFTGSALEAVLLFPPLPKAPAGSEEPAEQDRSQPADCCAEAEGAATITDGASGGASGGDESAAGEADAEAATSDVGAETASSELGADATSGEDDPADRATSGTYDTIRALIARRANEKFWADSKFVNGTTASVAWALMPLLSVGLLTPVAIGYAAYRVRSRALGIAATCYGIVVLATLIVSAAAPVGKGHAATGELLASCLGVTWVAGTAHSFLIRRPVFKRRRRRSRA